MSQVDLEALEKAVREEMPHLALRSNVLAVLAEVRAGREASLRLKEALAFCGQLAVDAGDAMDPLIFEKDWGSEDPTAAFKAISRTVDRIRDCARRALASPSVPTQETFASRRDRLNPLAYPHLYAPQEKAQEAGAAPPAPPVGTCGAVGRYHDDLHEEYGSCLSWIAFAPPATVEPAAGPPPAPPVLGAAPLICGCSNPCCTHESHAPEKAALKEGASRPEEEAHNGSQSEVPVSYGDARIGAGTDVHVRGGDERRGQQELGEVHAQRQPLDDDRQPGRADVRAGEVLLPRFHGSDVARPGAGRFVHVHGSGITAGAPPASDPIRSSQPHMSPDPAKHAGHLAEGPPAPPAAPAPPRPLVYLACPYSHDDRAVRVARFEAANLTASMLMRDGLKVFSPISHTHPIAEAGGLPLGWEFWEAFDRAYISHSRKVIVLKLDGWQESKGVQAEIRIAAEYGIPVEYTDPSYWKPIRPPEKPQATAPAPGDAVEDEAAAHRTALRCLYPAQLDEISALIRAELARVRSEAIERCIAVTVTFFADESNQKAIAQAIHASDATSAGGDK